MIALTGFWAFRSHAAAQPAPSCTGVESLDDVTKARGYTQYAKCGKRVAKEALQAAVAGGHRGAEAKLKSALKKYRRALRHSRKMRRGVVTPEGMEKVRVTLAAADRACVDGRHAFGSNGAAEAKPAAAPEKREARRSAALTERAETKPPASTEVEPPRSTEPAAVAQDMSVPQETTPFPETLPPEPTPPPPARASLPTNSSRVIAKLETVRGGVTVIRAGLSQPTSRPMSLERDDVVLTKRGRATVRFRSDGSTLRIGPDSRVQINESAKERGVTVFFGRIWSRIVRAKDKVSRFRGGRTIAAIRGTEISLGVAVDEDETRLAVVEGEVDAQNDAGSLTVKGGQTAVARGGSAPVLGTRVRPQDAVQWALYYPPVLQLDPGDLGQGSWQDAVRGSIQAHRQGDLQGAIDALASVDASSVDDPRYFSYRASLLLSAGKVDEAEQDIERTLGLDPEDGDALALRTTIAVANNETEQALETGQAAVKASPHSATAYVALSYAQQAAFDLDGARMSLEAAVTLDDSDALAWARLAEIRSSQGELKSALEAAEKAVAIQPDLSRTQTVLGFAHLLRLDTDEAKDAFGKAIELDQDDPLPRLGLGLAEVREGDVDEGIRHMEVAVSLDPGDAVIRSYLGKAYYEAKRTELSDREYDVAKAADPKDPTPWFYDAITKQTTNRPVEALESSEKAIEANDNRAVYRSRLLLDSDLAARSASVARIYSDLGFQDRALAEGWLSVNTDPTNHSAHRFLADSYAALPRHEIARVSELFQSQMLQPNNTTPIQPRLGESNLALISAGGPGSLAFNEFNPLFTRNGLTLQASGLAGTDGLWSGEGIAAGMYDDLSVSAGYSQFETDGWRDGEGVFGDNAFQKDKIANAFVQAELTPDLGVQAEYRFRDRAFGDLQQKYFRDANSSELRSEVERHTARVGGRYRLDPRNTVLASVIYQDGDFSQRDDRDDETVTRADDPTVTLDYYDATSPSESIGVEAQHLHRSRYFNLTSGFGWFNIDGEDTAQVGWEDGQVDPPLTFPESFDHVNAYSYAQLKPLRPLMVTAGVSFDYIDGDIPTPAGDDYQINPKVGVMWNPHASTTVRASAFRALKRTLITDQTLEPTQVSGFNQFYDDPNLADVWRYGAGVDQKIGSRVFLGAEYARRDITFPVIEFISFEDVPLDEHLVRGYLFAIPHRSVGLRAQYIFERIEEDDVGFNFTGLGFTTLDTHRVPLGVSLFHARGLSASFTATYWRQTGDLQHAIRGDSIPDRTSWFWLLDAALSYRLPKRYGFLSVGATNLTDRDFAFFEVDFDNVTILPKRTVFGKLTLALP